MSENFYRGRAKQAEDIKTSFSVLMSNLFRVFSLMLRLTFKILRNQDAQKWIDNFWSLEKPLLLIIAMFHIQPPSTVKE